MIRVNILMPICRPWAFANMTATLTIMALSREPYMPQREQAKRRNDLAVPLASLADSSTMGQLV